MLWHIFPASLKSNSAIEKKKKWQWAIILLASTCNHACESFSQQNSCYLQPNKSPNLLLSGKEPARVLISASVFSQSFYCLFSSECSKMDTSPFLFYPRRRVPFCPHLYYLHLKREFIASAIVGVIQGLFQVHIRRPNTAVWWEPFQTPWIAKGGVVFDQTKTLFKLL